MAIKLPDPGNGIPEQKTGNDEWTNMKIVRENFADQSNAASRLVGAGKDQLPDNEQALTTALNSTNYSAASLPLRSDGTQNIDKLPIGTRTTIAYTQIIAAPANSEAFNRGLIGHSNQIETFKINDRVHQLVKGHFVTGWAIRRTNDATTNDWTPLVPISSSEYTYKTTSATAANVVVGTDGVLRRAASSEKYKDILTDLELDDEAYLKALTVKPIVYRSKSEADPKHWHFLSFSAEELGAYDPALTQWRTHETDPETGLTVELEEKEAEGINLNAICAVLHATNIYQGKKLKELEKRLSTLES